MGADVGVQEPCEAGVGAQRYGAQRLGEPDPHLLERLGYRRQVNRKSLEGGHHVDRNAQFEHINAQVEAFQAAGQPVISVDTKKKELIGRYKNGGSDYRPQGCPDQVNVHDFVDENLGKAVPYGVYDSARTSAALASASITTPPNSPSTPFAAGARRWEASAIPPPIA